MTSLKELFLDYMKTAKPIQVESIGDISHSGIVIFVGDDYIRLADQFDVSNSSIVVTAHITAIYDKSI